MSCSHLENCLRCQGKVDETRAATVREIAEVMQAYQFGRSEDECIENLETAKEKEDRLWSLLGGKPEEER